MRAPIVFPIRVAAGASVVQTTTRELSTDGVFVCSLRPPKPGTRISLKLYLPGAPDPEEASAVVGEWRSAPDSGDWAEFDSPSQALRDRIVFLLDRRAPAPAPAPTPPGGAGPGGPKAPAEPAPAPPPGAAGAGGPRGGPHDRGPAH